MQAEPDFLGGRSRSRSRRSRRRVRGGDLDNRYTEIGGSGVRSRGRRSRSRGGKFMAFGGDLTAREILASGGSGVRGRSRRVRSGRRVRGGGQVVKTSNHGDVLNGSIEGGFVILG